MVKNVTANMTAKSVRLSAVALSTGVMTVIWLVIDEYTDLFISAAMVSAITSLVALVTQFLDFKADVEGDKETFGGESDGSDS